MAIPIIMPDLEVSAPVRATAWHARTGQSVVEGDRLVEVCAGPVSVDLPAPATGRLAQIDVEEDALVTPGQILGMIVPAE